MEDAAQDAKAHAPESGELCAVEGAVDKQNHAYQRKFYKEVLPQQRADGRDRERQQKAGDRLGVAGHRDGNSIARKPWHDTIGIGLGALSNFGLCALLVPAFGLTGAALALAASNGLAFLYRVGVADERKADAAGQAEQNLRRGQRHAVGHGLARDAA